MASKFFTHFSLSLHLLRGADRTRDDIVQNDFVIIVNVVIIERKKKVLVNESAGWDGGESSRRVVQTISIFQAG